MLNSCGAKVVADLLHDFLARCAIVAQHAHFDQFVDAEAAFQFGLHGWRHAASPYQHGRFQRMRASLQASTLCGRQLWWHGSFLKKAF